MEWGLRVYNGLNWSLLHRKSCSVSLRSAEVLDSVYVMPNRELDALETVKSYFKVLECQMI